MPQLSHGCQFSSYTRKSWLKFINRYGNAFFSIIISIKPTDFNILSIIGKNSGLSESLKCWDNMQNWKTPHETILSFFALSSMLHSRRGWQKRHSSESRSVLRVIFDGCRNYHTLPYVYGFVTSVCVTVGNASLVTFGENCAFFHLLTYLIYCFGDEVGVSTYRQPRFCTLFFHMVQS